MENQIEESNKTTELCKISVAEEEVNCKDRESELQDVGIAGGGTEGADVKCKKKG